MNSLKKLQRKIKYEFKNPGLVERALTHSSFANKNNLGSNELLEFLGDSVIGLVVTEYLYDSFPESCEGMLSKIKGNLCSRKHLNEKAKEIDLGEFLFIEPEEKIKDRKKNFLGNAYEALIGAIYLDSEFENTKNIIVELFSDDFNHIDLDNLKDEKTLLQELIQKEYQKTPVYRLIKEEGQAHDKTFYMEVLIPQGRFVGKGKSKKGAEADAAKSAVRKIK